MRLSIMTIKTPTFSLHKAIETLGLLGLLFLANWPLLTGGVQTDWIFRSELASAGQWYRLLTFPWVHLSWYHLLLDAGAFLLLWGDLHRHPLSRKLAIVAICGAASLFFALIFDNESGQLGLCGLSGIAHGLMVVSALNMAADGERRWGFAMLAMVLIKSLYEMITGTMLFEFLLLGLCGIPVAAAHAGGVAGGLLAYLLVVDPATPLLNRAST